MPMASFFLTHIILLTRTSANRYHIPVSEDAPVTPTTGNMLSFSLIPFNWANENPATDMADMIQITSNAPAVPAVKEALARCAPTFTDVPFGLGGWEAA